MGITAHIRLPHRFENDVSGQKTLRVFTQSLTLSHEVLRHVKSDRLKYI